MPGRREAGRPAFREKSVSAAVVDRSHCLLRRFGRGGGRRSGKAEVVAFLAVPGPELEEAGQAGEVAVGVGVDRHMNQRRLARGERALDRCGDVLRAVDETRRGRRSSPRSCRAGRADSTSRPESLYPRRSSPCTRRPQCPTRYRPRRCRPPAGSHAPRFRARRYETGSTSRRSPAPPGACRLPRAARPPHMAGPARPRHSSNSTSRRAGCIAAGPRTTYPRRRRRAPARRHPAERASIRSPSGPDASALRWSRCRRAATCDRPRALAPVRSRGPGPAAPWRRAPR